MNSSNVRGRTRSANGCVNGTFLRDRSLAIVGEKSKSFLLKRDVKKAAVSIGMHLIHPY